MITRKKINTSKARIYYTDGTVESFRNQQFAYTVWGALPDEIKVAFRGCNDTEPVHLWEYLGKPVERRRV